MTDKNWAQSKLTDPIHEPDPSDETGLNSHFSSTFAGIKSPTGPSTSQGGTFVRVEEQTGPETNPFRRASRSSNDGAAVHFSQTSRDYPSQPNPSSPRQYKFPTYREEEHFGGGSARRTSGDHVRTEEWEMAGRRRGSSLTERYPGDMSHKPLAMLKNENKAADRAPHLKKRHISGADVIDRLDDNVGGLYHHEGPYDAASLAMNNASSDTSPLAALKTSNQEALNATPREKIQDAVEKHRPLEGTAVIPPGHSDKFGRTYNYQEGTDMMREAGGDYKRWTGVDYQPGDVQGEGEPAYSLEQKLKHHKIDDPVGGESRGIELTERPGNSVDQRDPVEIAGGQQKYVELEQNMQRRESVGKSPLDGLKKKIGNLVHKKDKD